MTPFTYPNGADSAYTNRGCSSSSARPLVLIVEDHEDTRFMLRTLLQMRGMRVLEAEDGEAGVRAAEENRPDLVLLDTNLPRMDGLAVTRFIRASETLNRVPVVILSGHAFPKSREAAFAAGCSDYLVKPLDFDRLDSILHERLTSRLIGATPDGGAYAKGACPE